MGCALALTCLLPAPLHGAQPPRAAGPAPVLPPRPLSGTIPRRAQGPGPSEPTGDRVTPPPFILTRATCFVIPPQSPRASRVGTPHGAE